MTARLRGNAMTQQLGHAGAGHSAKHSGGHKHTHGKGKHHPRSKAKAASGHHAASGTNPIHVVAKPKKPARRGLALSGVACCPAEAVAVAARLAGWPVTEADVLDLYARCADGPSSGFTIAAALTAGISGCRPEFGALDAAQPWGRTAGCDPAALVDTPHDCALILGVDLPGPHAVTIGPDGTWWSWGKPFDPAWYPEMAVEEAWAVSFA